MVSKWTYILRFSNFSTLIESWAMCSKCKTLDPIPLWSSNSRGPGTYIFENSPGNPDAGGPWTTPWKTLTQWMFIHISKIICSLGSGRAWLQDIGMLRGQGRRAWAETRGPEMSKVTSPLLF